MAAPYYAGDALLLYGNLLDTKGLDPKSPTDDVDAAKVLVALEKIISERYTRAEMDLAKRDIAVMNDNLGLLKSVNDTRAKLAETKGRDRRATVEALTSRRNSIEKQRAYISGKMNASADMRAVEAAKTQAGPGEGNAAAGRAFINIRDKDGSRVDGEHPAVHAYAARFVQTTGNQGETLDNIDPTAFAQRIFPNDKPSADQLATILAGGKRTAASLSDAQVQLSNDLAEVGKGLSIASDDGKWNSLSEDQKQKIVQDEILRSGSAKSTLERILGRSEEDILVAKQKLVSEDEEYQRLLGLEKKMTQRLMDPGLQTMNQMAEIVASPTFRAWSESNGYRLGVSEMVDGKRQYVPSPDDVRAVLAYRWQLNHPNRSTPFSFGRGSTGALVRVTVEDPAKREVIMKQYAVNGKLYVDADGALVPPAELASAAREKGLVPQLQTAVVGDTTYIRMPDGFIVGADGRPAQLPEGAAPVFANAVVYSSDTADAKPVRYLTPADLGTANLENLVGSVGDEERQEFDAALTKASPYREASPEAIRAQSVTVVKGRLDKMHAADSATADGIGTVSLDGGRVRIPEAMKTTIEVLEAPDRTTLRDVWRAWRSRLSEHDAAQADREEGVSVDERMAAAERARREASEELASAKVPTAKPGAAAPGETVTVTTTDSFGRQKDVQVPAGSAAAPTPAAPAAAPTPAAPAAAPTPAAPSGKEYIRTSGGVYEVAPEGDLTKVMDADGNQVSEKIEAGTDAFKKVVADYRSGGADVDVAMKDGKVTSVVDKTAGAPLPTAGTAGEITRAELAREPEVGRRMAAAVIDYGKREKGLLGKAKEFVEGVGRGGKKTEGGVAPGEAPSPAPGEEVPPAKPPTLGERLKASREAARAAKARAEAEAARLKLPVAAELPDEGKLGAAAGGSMRFTGETAAGRGDIAAAKGSADEELNLGSAPEVREETGTTAGSLALSPATSPFPGAGGTVPSGAVPAADMTSEARKRAADAELLGKIRQTRGGTPDKPSLNFDLAMRAEALEQKRIEAEKARDLAARGGPAAPAFDAEAYAKEARAIADEARRRMTARDMPLRTSGEFKEGTVRTPDDFEVSRGTSSPLLEPSASVQAPSAAPVAAPDVGVRPEGLGSISRLMQEPAETAPAFRQRMTLGDRLGLDQRLRGVFARRAAEDEVLREATNRPAPKTLALPQRGAELPPSVLAIPAGRPSAAQKSEEVPVGAKEATELQPVFRTDNPNAVPQYIRNVYEENQKPTFWQRLAGRRKPAAEPAAESPPKP